jgi:hypothetical protein
MNVILTPGAKLRSSQGMKKMWLPDLQWQSYEWMARNHGVQSCRSTSITLQPEMRSSGGKPSAFCRSTSDEHRL